MKTITLAVLCSLMMLLGGRGVGLAAAETVLGSLGCTFCADLYEVTCSGSQDLLVNGQNAVVGGAALIVNGIKTFPAPALGGPVDAFSSLKQPGDPEEDFVFRLPKEGLLKVLVSIGIGNRQSDSADYSILFVCRDDLDQPRPAVIKLKQDQ